MSTRNFFNISGRKLFCCLLIISFVLPLRAEESVAPERVELEGHAKTQIPEKENLENLTWEGKKTLLGMGIFSGIGVYSDYDQDLNFLMDFVQFRLRFLLRPDLPLFINGCLNSTLSTPFSVNLGYGKGIKNIYWYIAGGGGLGMSFGLSYTNFHPFININTGVDWLVSKSYSIGLNFNIGHLFLTNYGDHFNRYYIILSVTTNLVL